jgi:hypothetical protein
MSKDVPQPGSCRRHHVLTPLMPEMMTVPASQARLIVYSRGVGGHYGLRGRKPKPAKTRTMSQKAAADPSFNRMRSYGSAPTR